MKHKILSAILAFTLTFCILPHTGMAAGTDELSTAVEYVTAQNIFVGDGSGNLELASGLTRAELAVLLVRIRGDEETVKADAEYYSFGCHFDDVPEWAEPYVGYCADWQLLNGYSLFVYAPNDRVTPQQACTVILRNMGIPEKTWSYATAVSDAGELGITPASGFTDMSAVKRGEMAVLIHKSATRPANGTTGTDRGQTKVLDGNSYAREDFSAQANPAVFDDYYTRGIYNVVRQMILDYDVIAAGMDENGYNPDYDYPHVIGHDKSYYVIDEVFGTLMAYHRYQRFGEPGVKNIWQYPSYSSATVVLWNQHLNDVDKATDDLGGRHVYRCRQGSLLQ